MSPPGGRADCTECEITPASLENGLNQEVYVLDGGFATQLTCHVDEPIDGDPLWSARFLATNPEAVINTHLDFLRAGADIIMTNTYQASVSGFVDHLNLTEEESVKLIEDAVDMARTASDRFAQEYSNSGKPRSLIAGSVGPYGASLHDGSEYTGSYISHVSAQTMRDWHRPRIEALIRRGVDLLAIETIPSIVEAEMLVELIREYPDVKAWLTFSCRDGHCTSYGEDFQEAVRKCYDLNPKQLVAVGVNCIQPKHVETLFKGINSGRDDNPIPLIVYPNSGENYNPQLGWIDREKCEPVEIYVRSWLDLGITYIGGCCRTYAADVSRIRNQVLKWKVDRQNNKLV